MALITTGKTIRLFLYKAVLGLLRLSGGCRETKATAAPAQHGLLDLSSWNLGKDGPVNFVGEWEFY
jgi:hypothetical protein